MESSSEGEFGYESTYKGPADPRVVWGRARAECGIPDVEVTPEDRKLEVRDLFIKFCGQIRENGGFEFQVDD